MKGDPDRQPYQEQRMHRYSLRNLTIRHMLSLPAVALLASLGTLPGTTASAQSPQDLFPGAPTGRLYITLELKGSGRKDLPNKVEWSRLTTSRKIELELAMVVPGPAVSPAVPVGNSDPSTAGMPPGMAAMAKAVKDCGEDEGCQKRAIAAFTAQMMANPKAMGTTKLDTKRYENWVADRRGACAKGNVLIEDEGDGVNIAPPSPAAPYRFKRTGRLALPVETSAVVEKICDATIAIDTQSNLLSIRLGTFDFQTPVQLQGQAFTKEKSVPFLEGASRIELLDQPFNVETKEGAGTRRLPKLGSVSHNSGSTIASVEGNLTWRFVRN